MPKVSVLVPIYKTNEKHLAEAIESILSQTYEDFELILLDDCPEQSREQLIRKYNDSRIIYYKNTKNLGISASRNKLLSLSKGEYLAIFDHDDVSLPTRLEKQVGFLESHPDVGVVSSNIKLIHSGKRSHNPENNLQIKSQLRYECAFFHTSAMIRKSILIENDIHWESQYSPAEDYMLWARLMGKTMFHCLNEVLVLYRDHDNNTSSLQKDKMKDRDWMVKQFIARQYPTPMHEEGWIQLFGFLPFIKIKTTPTRKRYSLFGLLPIAVHKFSK